MRIELHIERLVLDGLPLTRADGALVQAAVEAELARLLAEGGLGPGLLAGVALPSLRVDAVQLAAGSSPAQIGQQIGRAVFGGLGRGDERVGARGDAPAGRPGGGPAGHMSDGATGRTGDGATGRTGGGATGRTGGGGTR